jgi:lipid II:glycine glycyltransferase (peptidoglycan interpeptide bridge formation enzyme)
MYDPPAEQWDEFVMSYPQGHLLQLTRWAELKTRFGWRARRVALVQQERIVAGAQLLLRPLVPRLGQGPCLAYVPKGPLVNWGDAYATAVLLHAIHPVVREEGGICLTVEPDLPQTPALDARLRECSFRPAGRAIQPTRTLHVDLRPSDEEILLQMKSKTRYNIRLAGRRGVNVRVGNVGDIEVFYQLSQKTAERDQFAIHSREYYRTAYDLFAPSGMARLLVAEHEGQPLAALMVFACGRQGWYFYGASSDEERQRMPNYALQWAAMQWAKAQGCELYDLWGVPDAEENALEAEFAERSDGLWGVYRFKRGFGGRLVQYVGAYDYVYRPMLYRIYRQALRWHGKGQA